VFDRNPKILAEKGGRAQAVIAHDRGGGAVAAIGGMSSR
jgi:hypothetical protein